MKYKLIAVDVDGTLLNSKDIITDITKKKIKEAKDSGAVFVISTGRPLQGVIPLVKDIGFDIPLILYNGALVVLEDMKSILFESKLSSKDALNIYEMGIKNDVTIIVWINNKLYTNKINKRSKKYADQANCEPEIIKDYQSRLSLGATKLLWYDDVEKIDIYDNDLSGRLADTITFHKSKPFYLEFVDSSSSKALALEKIGKYYNIKPDEMIAVGDSYNDLSMLKYAGLGVSMGNADYSIRKEADFITSTNDDEGISYVIDKFILEKR